VLETNRLFLRLFQERDLAPYAEINADPAVVEFLGKGGGVENVRRAAQRPPANAGTILKGRNQSGQKNVVGRLCFARIRSTIFR
jgi:hypothetical protein